jgi:hypothetical protein
MNDVTMTDQTTCTPCTSQFHQPRRPIKLTTQSAKQGREHQLKSYCTARLLTHQEACYCEEMVFQKMTKNDENGRKNKKQKMSKMQGLLRHKIK